MATTPSDSTLVVVIDDDESVRTALESLLRSLGFRVELFASAEAFLLRAPCEPACLIVDVRMPGMSGFDLQRKLEAAGASLPTIFISALDDAALRRSARRAGKSAFLCKPFAERSLLAAIRATLGVALESPPSERVST